MRHLSRRCAGTLARRAPRTVLAALALVATAACSGGSDGPTESEPPGGGGGGGPGAVASVSVTLPSAAITVGGSATPQATARDAQGRTVPATFAWSSSDTDVATVAAGGAATGVTAGTTTITATTAGISGDATLRVDPRNLDALVEEIRAARGVPALAGAIVTSKGLVGVGVAGSRRATGGAAATRGDRWHIGSNLKALTAALAAVAVARGEITWTTTVAQSFPELAATMRPQYRTVTLEQLLANGGGIRNDPPASAYAGTTARQQRESLAAWALAAAPIGAAGSYHYSNPGFAIAGAMLERAMGGTYEELLASRLLTPLGATTLGWGPTTTAGGTDQPVGHRWQGSGWVACTTVCDNPPGLSAAGRAHIGIEDWGRVITELLAADDGQSTLIRQADARKLFTTHTPMPVPGDSYALGWIATTRPWAGGPTATHSGTNTFNHSVAWLGLQTNVAFLAVTNASDAPGGNRSAIALDALIGRMLQLHQSGN